MSKTIVLQKSHSRNSKDWTRTMLANGRHAFVANQKGVAQRIGFLVDFLGKNPKSSAREMADFLLTVHESYTINDVSQPMKQMVKLGMVNANGNGRARTYSLTSNGLRIWKSVTRKFR